MTSLVLLITNGTKLEIQGHVVQSFSRKCISTHKVLRLLYERDGVLERKRLPLNREKRSKMQVKVKDLKV